MQDDPDILIYNEKVTKHLIQLSIFYRELDDGNDHISEYVKAVERFYDTAKYVGKLLYIMENKSVIIRKYESLNSSRSVDEQIYPIPEQGAYNKNYQEYLIQIQRVERMI
ncbi:hypothetical protein [Acinetobacter sp. ANC 4173]|uniref:hypothetical protein n=1 Tax=Acinetobacter sp. ANC 4173 TaxID=2529837 RepID=UPI00103E4E22|nr:hypothetical protein [Acinetobacter sp. ANC 4173]TCB74174.1 hypothetical protein E0H94_17730 [Acinetobacter sp. ANC 4173]